MPVSLTDPLTDAERHLGAWLLQAASNYADKQSLSTGSVGRVLFRVALIAAVTEAIKHDMPSRDLMEIGLIRHVERIFPEVWEQAMGAVENESEAIKRFGENTP